MILVRKHEPVPEEEMNYVSPHETICAILRDIYFVTQNADIKLKARIAMSMAKGMNRKLKTYKANWDDEFFQSASKNDIANRRSQIYLNKNKRT